ncbi:ABC transporter substrate-binding protein [Nakamurella sp. PAMC28650]|uniref:ABC transporter substrate-binding protein n=1 Tax=Nakamurella sp. PAMC28650 TaxID=2762325 RepID=UPI00164D24DA|nr:ABC transporter substrate-binding protein [Nakamurella sp. PAMC28650]QNK80516.1 ABC transporter substrate-binding protein [Nakamurella sp. PAMC28650]
MPLKPAIIVSLVLCAAFVAGCGTSGTAANSSASTTAPSSAAGFSTATSAPAVGPASSATTSGPGSSAPPAAPASVAPTSPKPPQRIVSLSPTATEDLFAIGAGSQVVAVDSNSNYPSTVPKTTLSAYEPNVESIAKYQPDLVVISDDINNIKAQLTKLSIPVLVEPAATSLNDAYQQINSLGSATGHVAEASKTVASMRSGIATSVATVPKRTVPLTYFHELDNTLYTVSSKTFVGQIYALAGLEDVADPANTKSAAYPQLSAEYLVKSDPDLIFLADVKCCRQSAATFAARPGFSALSAVRDRRVVLLDDDVASRWGPRVVQLLQKIVDAVKSVRS